MDLDITYLKTTVKGAFYCLFMVLELWTRKIVGFEVHQAERASYAAQLVSSATSREGVVAGGLVLHSDNGSPMKGATILAKLQELGIAESFSRPSVSNDKPFSESLFRAANYRAEFPTRPFEGRDMVKSCGSNLIEATRRPWCRP